MVSSRHEGQVLLKAKYPAGSHMFKAEFEDSLREILSSEGQLFAWAKQPATESGTFSMVAEFCDADHAARAVHSCNGRTIGVSIKCNFNHVKFSSDISPDCNYTSTALDSRPTCGFIPAYIDNHANSTFRNWWPVWIGSRLRTAFDWS